MVAANNGRPGSTLGVADHLKALLLWSDVEFYGQPLQIATNHACYKDYRCEDLRHAWVRAGLRRVR